MALYVSGKELAEVQSILAPLEGNLRMKVAFGADQGLAVVERGPGYHSQPRVHDCEQLIYGVEGETWFFIEDKGYHLRPGDFLRVPRMQVHWERNRSSHPCTTVYGTCPVLDPFTRRGAVGLFGEREDPALRGSARSIPVSEEYLRAEEKIVKPETGGLYAAGEDVPEVGQVMQVKGGSLATRFVYGHDLNLMVGTRPGGYHSRPHFHDCEQMNYVADGEMWIFIEDEGHHLRPGDFLRVPRLAVHWAWNRADRTCVLYETHAPPFDPRTIRGSVGLFEEGEPPHPPKVARNIFTPDNSAVVEAKYP